MRRCSAVAQATRHHTEQTVAVDGSADGKRVKTARCRMNGVVGRNVPRQKGRHQMQIKRGGVVMATNG
uniref:40S ribosomal protein S30 n=1 Tax=Ascaris lumbricoides TaxID=6252 RepID=A0A0M3HR96_ASCLU